MTTAASRQAAITPLIVLSKIIELTGKSEIPGKPPVKTVRIDTLALIFGMRHSDIRSLLQDLEAHGNVQCHFPEPNVRRSNNMGMVELLDYPVDQSTGEPRAN